MPFSESQRPDGKRERRYHDLPKNASCREFVIRELDGTDDLTVGMWVDRKVTDVIANNAVALMDLRKHEAMRCSLVSVDGKEVNLHNVPYAAMDTWTQRTLTALATAFHRLNGLEADELKNLLAEDEPSDASLPSLAPVRSTDERSAG